MTNIDGWALPVVVQIQFAHGTIVKVAPTTIYYLCLQ